MYNFLLNIREGDDCISIESGSQKVLATGITCGPGHGIRLLHYNISTQKLQQIITKPISNLLLYVINNTPFSSFGLFLTASVVWGLKTPKPMSQELQ